VEPNHGEVDVISERGDVRRLVDVSATQGHIVPTSITFHGGVFYLGNLGVLGPGSQGHANVYRLTRTGSLSLLKSGLTAVVGVAVHDGHVYALESFTGVAPTPDVADTGTVVRLNRRTGNWDTVVTGLSFPTAMTFGPDGNLYVSNKGFVLGQPANHAGEVVKVALQGHDEDDD
jgi:outer membrane protein assembly factor BamB